MMNFDEQASFDFQFQGNVYQVRYATKEDVDKYQKLMDDAGEDTDLVHNAAFKFIEILGASEEVTRKLPMKCLKQLIEEAIDLEKK